jgi:hypothetical protein
VALRAYIQGSKFYDPDGNEFIPFGTNSRFELTQPRDGVYVRDCLGCNTIRIEIPWWQTGSAGDARDDSAPFYFSTTYLDTLRKQIGYYRAAGLWVHLALHSKCGRSGQDDGAGLGAYCGSVGPYATPGRNFWSDPTQEVIHDSMLYGLTNAFKNIDGILMWEMINEPDPTGFSDVQVNAYQGRRMTTMLSASKDELFLLGPNGSYLAAKIATSYQPGYINKFALTADLFNQQGSGADTAARLAQWEGRFQSCINARDSLNVPVVIQQFGATNGDDPDNSNLEGQLMRLLAARIGGYQWEDRAPGPGGGTFGWLQLQADVNAPDIVAHAREILMQKYSRQFSALTPAVARKSIEPPLFLGAMQ